MRPVSVLDLLAAGRAVRRADVLTVAEVIATGLAADHSRGAAHGDVGPHTVLLELNDAGRIRDARLLAPHPSGRPAGWPVSPEGGATGDAFALGQVLRSLDAAARGTGDDVGLPDAVRGLIDPDPARRLTVEALLQAIDEGRVLLPDDTAPTVAPPAGAPHAVLAHSAPAPLAEAGDHSWRLPVAAVAVFALVLGGGLWWIQQGREPEVQDAAPAIAADSQSNEADPTEAATAPPTEPVVGAPDPSGPAIGPTGRPAPGAQAPAITGSDGEGPTDTVAKPPPAEGSTEFDQAWCRSHGRFVVRAQTNSFTATICRDGDTVNYHGRDLVEGRSFRVLATEHGAGWTGQGPDGVTYEITEDHLEVRQEDGVVLASEEIVTRIDQSQDGAFRPWDLAAPEPISYPACDGAAIVVVDTYDNLQGVNVQVRESLEARPGASYLNTDATCDSVQRPGHTHDNRFLIYYWAGPDEEEACALAAELDGQALWLRDDVDPLEPVTCS